MTALVLTAYVLAANLALKQKLDNLLDDKGVGGVKMNWRSRSAIASIIQDLGRRCSVKNVKRGRHYGW